MEEPKHPDLILDNDGGFSPEEAADEICRYFMADFGGAVADDSENGSRV